MKQLLVVALLLWQLATASASSNENETCSLDYIDKINNDLHYAHRLKQLEEQDGICEEVSNSNCEHIITTAKRLNGVMDYSLRNKENFENSSLFLMLIIAGSISLNIIRHINLCEALHLTQSLPHVTATLLADLILLLNEREYTLDCFKDNYVLCALLLAATCRAEDMERFSRAGKWLLTHVKSTGTRSTYLSLFIDITRLDTPVPCSMYAINTFDSAMLVEFMDLYVVSTAIESCSAAYNTQHHYIYDFVVETGRRKLFLKLKTARALLKPLPHALRHIPEIDVRLMLQSLQHIILCFGNEIQIMEFVKRAFVSERLLTAPSDQLDLQGAADVLTSIIFVTPDFMKDCASVLSENVKQRLSEIYMIRKQFKMPMALLKNVKDAFAGGDDRRFKEAYRTLREFDTAIKEEACPLPLHTVAGALNSICAIASFDGWECTRHFAPKCKCEFACTCQFTRSITKHQGYTDGLKAATQAALTILSINVEALQMMAAKNVVVSVGLLQIAKDSETLKLLARISQKFTPAALAELTIRYYEEVLDATLDSVSIAGFFGFTHFLGESASDSANRFSAMVMKKDPISFFEFSHGVFSPLVDTSAFKLNFMLTLLSKVLIEKDTDVSTDQILSYIEYMEITRGLSRVELDILVCIKTRLETNKGKVISDKRLIRLIGTAKRESLPGA